MSPQLVAANKIYHHISLMIVATHKHRKKTQHFDDFLSLLVVETFSSGAAIFSLLSLVNFSSNTQSFVATAGSH